MIFYLNEEVDASWKDNITLLPSDGVNQAPAIVLYILILPVSLPIVVRPIIVEENLLARIEEDHITVSHPAYLGLPATVAIREGPHHGRLVYVGTGTAVGSSFSLSDLQSSNNPGIVYVHDGSDTVEDSIHFQVTSNGSTSNLKTLNIFIIPVNDERPVLRNQNLTLELWNGDSVQLDPEQFVVEDKDTLSTEIMYIFAHLDNENLSKGHFAWVGYPNLPIYTFSQYNISQKTVYYMHRGWFNVTLPFIVSDGANIVEGTLNIVGKPFYIVVSNRSDILHVNMEDFGIVGTRNLLSYTTDGRDRHFVYTVVSAFQYGHFLKDGSRLQTGGNFTQEDINSGSIIYHHTDMDRWEEYDSMEFQAWCQYAEMAVIKTLVIGINLRRTPNSNLSVNVPLVVVENQSVCLTEKNLDARNIRYTAWQQNNSYSLEELRIGYKNSSSLSSGEFRFISPDNQSFPVTPYFYHQNPPPTVFPFKTCYRHNGSETLADSLWIQVHIYKLSGNDKRILYSVAEQFHIQIIPVNDRQPEVHAKSTLNVTVVEGFSVNIAPDVLSVTDADNSSSEISFTVIHPPENGQLNLIKFSQQDINEGKLSYIHEVSTLGT